MANELRYNFSVSMSNGGAKDSYSVNNMALDQSVDHLCRNVVTLVNGGAHSLLDLADVATVRMAVFSNLSATGTVQVGVDVGGNFYPFLSIPPGQQSGPILMGTSAIYAKAVTDDADLFYILYSI
jgi:hypothetical protein